MRAVEALLPVEDHISAPFSQLVLRVMDPWTKEEGIYDNDNNVKDDSVKADKVERPNKKGGNVDGTNKTLRWWQERARRRPG